MEKLHLRKLVLELTRRCNANPICPHCYRGAPQNVDLGFEAIDNLLNNVSEIDSLSAFGGEPTLNLPALDHFISKMQEKGIPLHSFGITTNGLQFTEQFEKTILQISDYMKESNFWNREYITERPTVAVSIDNYHNNKSGAVFFEKCKKAFSPYDVYVVKETSGDTPNAQGNAINLALASPKPDVLRKNYRVKLKKVINGTVVSDEITLAANGKLYFAMSANNEYEFVESIEPIVNCTIPFDLLECIKKYNVGKENFIPVFPEDYEHEIKRDLYLSNLEFVVANPYFSSEERDLARKTLDGIYKMHKDHPLLTMVEAVDLFLLNIDSEEAKTESERLDILEKARVVWNKERERAAQEEKQSRSIERKRQYTNRQKIIRGHIEPNRINKQ